MVKEIGFDSEKHYRRSIRRNNPMMWPRDVENPGQTKSLPNG
jgi:hypothetical protein